jgi:hypothetical protein
MAESVYLAHADIPTQQLLAAFPDAAAAVNVHCCRYYTTAFPLERSSQGPALALRTSHSAPAAAAAAHAAYKPGTCPHS